MNTPWSITPAPLPLTLMTLVRSAVLYIVAATDETGETVLTKLKIPVAVGAR